MTTASVDIIVPVWNFPFETRACLAALLLHSPEARLIIVDNGSSRETELMLEEFSEPLGERGLFIKSERNIGLVAAINLGLARSDSAFSVIVRPHVLITAGWLDRLLEAADSAAFGIVSPLFSGKGAPHLPLLTSGCTLMESCSVSFTVLLLRGEMKIMTGLFDEQLDGGEWCLKDYVRRAADKGYRTCISGRIQLMCGVEPLFGTANRRTTAVENSRAAYLSRWGEIRHYCIYFGNNVQAGSVSEAVEKIVESARQGHRFTLLLHYRQHREFCRQGWNGLHTGIELIGLSWIFSVRDLLKKMGQLTSANPDMIMVRGTEGALFPGVDAALSAAELFENIAKSSTGLAARHEELRP